MRRYNVTKFEAAFLDHFNVRSETHRVLNAVSTNNVGCNYLWLKKIATGEAVFNAKHIQKMFNNDKNYSVEFIAGLCMMSFNARKEFLAYSGRDNIKPIDEFKTSVLRFMYLNTTYGGDNDNRINKLDECMTRMRPIFVSLQQVSDLCDEYANSPNEPIDSCNE